MVYPIRSLGLCGITGYEVWVECDLSNGLPAFTVVGLPDTAVNEARERVRAAVKNCGFTFPVNRITVNLAPAHVKKVGTWYDLPILVGLLIAGGQLPPLDSQAAFLGELSLSGQVRPCTGMLPMALAAKRAGVTQLFVPCENAPEAALADGPQIYPVATVQELVQHMRGEQEILPLSGWTPPPMAASPLDLTQVKGQELAKRALELAAAGGHHLLMVGPPGSGKSMLAKRLPSILPHLTWEESLEVTEIYSVLGLLDAKEPLITHRPFRAPHHSISSAGLAGGGSIPRPGEISLAHHGVLFLDELPEFQRDTLEILRQPLEDGHIQLSRSWGSITYPSSLLLICAMNPCKCGWHGHPSGRCTCSPREIHRYLSRLSGPLLDRIDLFVQVDALTLEELTQKNSDHPPSSEIQARVNQVRTLQRARTGGCNAQMAGQDLEEHCNLDQESQGVLRGAFARMGLTARSYDRIRRVARTIADLESSAAIHSHHLAEALQYRPPTYLRR